MNFGKSFKKPNETRKNDLNKIMCLLKTRKAQIETMQSESLNVLSHRLYCLVKLRTLLECGKKSIPDLDDEHFLTIRNIMTRANKGIFSELVAEHVVLNEYAPKLLSLFDDEDEIGEITKDEIKSSRDEYVALLGDHQLKQFYGSRPFFAHTYTHSRLIDVRLVFV